MVTVGYDRNDRLALNWKRFVVLYMSAARISKLRRRILSERAFNRALDRIEKFVDRFIVTPLLGKVGEEASDY